MKTLTGADDDTSGGDKEIDVPGEVRHDRAPGSTQPDTAWVSNRASLDEVDKGQSNRSPKMIPEEDELKTRTGG